MQGARRVAPSRRWLVGLVVAFIVAALALFVMPASPALAADCGAALATINGVDVKSNGVYQGTGDSCGSPNSEMNSAQTPGGTTVSTGYMWQCVEFVNRYYVQKGWISARWAGSGSTLKDSLPGGLTFMANGSITSIVVGDVVTLSYSTFGHAGVVSGVSGNTITIANQNAASVYGTATYDPVAKTLSSEYSGYTTQGIVHATANTTSGGNNITDRIGAVLTDGTFQAKDGIGGGWATEYGGVKTTYLSGNRIGAVLIDGTFLAKDGTYGGWVTEQGAVAGAYFAGDRIGALLTDGTFLVKDGLYGGWVTEMGNVKTAYLSGNRIGAVLTDGTLLVKDGTYGGWVTEQGAVTTAYFAGDRIGALLTNGTFLIKDGIYGGWVTEMGNVKTAYLSGNRIGVVLIDGTLLVKDGTYGGWVTENGGVASAYFAGDRIGALMTDGTFLVKDGVYGGWVTEMGNVKAAYLVGHRIGALLLDGILLAKDGTYGGWVTEQGSVASAAFS